MARSLCPASWLFFILIAGAASITSGFTGCGGVSKDPPPVPTASPAQDACAVPAAPTSFNEQFLIAGDVLESNTFFVYRLDQQTGVPTAMPWSPMLLDGSVMSETPDAGGNYIYLGVRTGLDTASLETFRFPADDSAPVPLDSQSLKADQLTFDPQQRYALCLQQTCLNPGWGSP